MCTRICGRCERFFSLNVAEGFFFFFLPRLPLNKGETQGYAKLTAEEIAVKRSQHFFFLLPRLFFFPCIASVTGL